MSGADVNVGKILDRFVTAPAGDGDWGAVVRDANLASPRNRRRLGAEAAIGVAVIAVALVALLAPSRHGGGSIVERARAAIGNGPVLHIVMRYPVPRYTVVDLKTGRERPV